jgi:hypothetical protein
LATIRYQASTCLHRATRPHFIDYLVPFIWRTKHTERRKRAARLAHGATRFKRWRLARNVVVVARRSVARTGKPRLLRYAWTHPTSHRSPKGLDVPVRAVLLRATCFMLRWHPRSKQTCTSTFNQSTLHFSARNPLILKSSVGAALASRNDFFWKVPNPQK